MKYAHRIDDRLQTIKNHLIKTAEKASDNSNELMRNLAYTAGLAHDIGKYSQAFQKRLFGGKNRYEHSVCGAIELGKLAADVNQKAMTYMLQYCIAGHHTGLPDGGTDADSDEADSTLHARLKREKYYKGEDDYSSFKEEIDLSLPDYSLVLTELSKSKDKADFIERYAFFTRYLFSCLTDADYIDTEIFCSTGIDRTLRADFKAAEKALDEKFSSFDADTPLKKARNILQAQAIANGLGKDRISILNMPTGSGKTLCSMKIALEKLREHKKKRIIYVIPYTSIIEQTAEIFENLFGNCVDIVQHHSNYCFDTDNDSTEEKLRRSTENWDAPIIITTSVQFFQSLYHYRGSGLRKLHNLADSVIIFDEVHMLPIEYLQPCLRGIGYITEYLNSEVVFLSATMPDYSELTVKYIGEYKLRELIEDKSAFSYFRKCRYTYLGQTEIETIAAKADEYKSSLIIVNKKKTAKELYRILSGKKYHLSANMTPHDRSETIRCIRTALESEEKITVVSTSLVEAGVDLDFDAVFRQLAGLDNILQSGGRCNREGKLECGDVYIFETDEKIRGDIQIRSSIVKALINDGEDISSERCIEEYYRRLFKYCDELIDKNTIAKDVCAVDCIPFRKYAENFRFISEETISVVINNNDETAGLLAQLEHDRKNIKRKLQRYSVSLKIKGELNKALTMGLLSDDGNGVYVLSNNDYYNAETGLDLDKSGDGIFA